jgi:hypothetical protein
MLEKVICQTLELRPMHSPYCLYAMGRIYDGVRDRGFAGSMNSTHFMRVKGLGRSIKRQR